MFRTTLRRGTPPFRMPGAMPPKSDELHGVEYLGRLTKQQSTVPSGSLIHD